MRPAARLKRFLKDEQGSTSIEYALIGALIFMVIVVSINSLGDSVTVMYNKIGTAVTTATKH